MKMRRNFSSVAVSTAMATLLAACSANPVEDTNNKTPVAASGKAVTKIAEKSPTKVADVPSKDEAKAKNEALEKKKTIIAMAKPQLTPSQQKAAAIRLAKTQEYAQKREEYNRVAREKQQLAATRAELGAKKAAAKPVVQLASAARPRVVQAKRQPVKANYQKAVYRKPFVQKVSPRKAIQRIDPSNSFGYALSNAAIERTTQRVRYDGSYVKIGYPWGDVPKSIGVCTDVVIRSYRRLGIDLQQEVHQDISKDFYAYPNLTKWGLEKPDPNIDHRRVYNLQAFFKRHKAELPRTRNPRDYKPGDLVTWMVGPSFPHIGVVVNIPTPSDPNRMMIAHNVGAGPVIEDILFRFPMTGHYRYTPAHRKINPAVHFAKTPAPASVQRKQQQSQVSYAQLVQASKYLTKAAPLVPDQEAEAKKPPAKLYLAQLDSVLASKTNNLSSDAVKALLKK